MKKPESYWDKWLVRTAKVHRDKIAALMRKAGCKTFSDYVRHLIRVQLEPGP